MRKRGKRIATMWRTDANALLTDCGYVANKLRIRGEHSANTSRTDCNNVANKLRIRGERIAIMQHSKNKNHTFVTQKPPFCTSKTILLHVKNHTFVMRICNIQKTNTLQTFRKCVANTPKLVANTPQYTHVHPRNWLRTNCGCAANGLPNIADGLPKRYETRCIIRHSAQQCTNIQT